MYDWTLCNVVFSMFWLLYWELLMVGKLAGTYHYAILGALSGALGTSWIVWAFVLAMLIQ